MLGWGVSQSGTARWLWRWCLDVLSFLHQHAEQRYPARRTEGWFYLHGNTHVLSPLMAAACRARVSIGGLSGLRAGAWASVHAEGARVRLAAMQGSSTWSSPFCLVLILFAPLF